jgi:serine/threonine protein kinase
VGKMLEEFCNGALQSMRFPWWVAVLIVAETCVLQVLTEPPPTGEGLGMSDSFVDFVSRCLKSDEKERISSSEILKHPFILNNTV